MTATGALRELPDLVPPEVSRAYERWLAERPSDDAYLYTDARVRFEPRDDDIVVPTAGLVAHELRSGTRLTAPSLSQPLEVAAPRDGVVRFLATLDGETTLAEARTGAGLAANACEALVRATFGVVLFAPLAIAELERAVPAAEIVRFPGSPYEIPRSYWSNMATVRRLVPRLFARVAEPHAALDELRRLHVVALVGEDHASFYRPASPIAKKGITPGKLWLAATRTLETPEGTRLVEGPRVHAGFLGGERYGALVAELAGDPSAADDRLEHRDASGLAWGRVVFGRAEGETRDAPWFCPPRPLSSSHVESTFRSLGDAAAGAPFELGALADFHQKLIRLHLFRAANQSLAMAIVNALLARANDRTPAPSGIPHLVLDQLALRLSPDAYRKVFGLAAREWTAEGSPAERLRLYADKKRRSYALIERLGATRDAREARRAAEASPAAARLALLDLESPNG